MLPGGSDDQTIFGNHIGGVDEIHCWQELQSAIFNETLYCTGLRGFGCEVPAANRLLATYLNLFSHHFPRRCDKLIRRLRCDIQDSWNANTIEMSSNSWRHAVPLCYAFAGIRQYCQLEKKHTNNYVIGWSWVRTAVEVLLSIPSQYLHAGKVRVIAGCILFTQSISRVLDISDLLACVHVRDWFAGDDELQLLANSNGVKELLDSISVIEFASQEIGMWLSLVSELATEDSCFTELTILSSERAIVSLWQKAVAVRDACANILASTS
jgi:hypothetical protein